jgi:hypothetical protein
MDGPGFDRWTRRRFGRVATGFAASTLAVLGLAETEANKRKRKRRKKRCKRHLQPCQKGGKRKCCGDLLCDVPSGEMADQTVCCKPLGKPCSKRSDCCADLCCEGEEGSVCQTLCT